MVMPLAEPVGAVRTHRATGRAAPASVPSGNLRREVVEVGRLCSLNQRRLVHLVADLDRSREWLFDGSATCAHWVARALDIEVCTAREWLRIGTKLQRLAIIDEAFAAGRISYSKVRALTRVADADNEQVLCDLAERTRAGDLARALAAWLGRHEEPDETEKRQHEARFLSWHLDVDGMVVGSFRFPAAMAMILIAVIESWIMRYRPPRDLRRRVVVARPRARPAHPPRSCGRRSANNELMP